MRHLLRVVLAAGAVVAVLSGCATAQPRAIATPTAMTTSLTAPPTISLDCDETFELSLDRAGRPDFTALWEAGATDCNELSHLGVPISPFEFYAYTGGHPWQGNHLETLGELYARCGSTDTLEEFETATGERRPPPPDSLAAALRLCPDHPFRGFWRTVVRKDAYTLDDLAPPPSYTVVVECSPRRVTVRVTDGRPDFRAAWAAKPKECDDVRRVASLSRTEVTALRAAPPSDVDVDWLYLVCAQLTRDIEQDPAARLLCPDHPRLRG
ncbi:hypothetical protein ACIBG7_29780 [Nonomuraea sp. NPDC050328]|uniref:hypothetical protein n=1 Tax=Nonomuraea sp. NPDC050328 TaxID=3364361 RepID=UPI0037A61417